MRFVAVFLIAVLCQAEARDVDHCYAAEDDPYLYLATRTAYHFVRGGKTPFDKIPNCQPAQLWMFATYGTRCPTSEEITRMLKLNELRDMITDNHETRGNGRLCNIDLENLKRWETGAYLAMRRAENLTPQGVEDMRLLARRLQSNFPELLQSSEDMIPEYYKFKAGDSRDSMASFIEGLFGSRTAAPMEYESGNDTILNGYQSCDAWNNAQNETIEELEKFESGPLFQNLLQNVSRRAGFLYDLDADTILTMYDMCRYEKAWTVTKLSPWCAVFSKAELRVLEYREDLKFYYTAGYGHHINSQLGCTILQDMMSHFRKRVEEPEAAHPKGVFYFADQIGLQNLLTAMEINKDDTRLLASNYKEMAPRQWRTSFLSPFAGNLVAALYKCDDSMGAPYKVTFYLAEKLVQMKGCSVGLCDWHYLKNKFDLLAPLCNREACYRGNGGDRSSYSGILLFSLALLLVSFEQ